MSSTGKTLALAVFFVAGLQAQTSDEFLKQAAALAENHDILKAIELLETALEAFPEDPAILHRQSLFFLSVGKTRAAEVLVDRALSHQPSNSRYRRTKGEIRLLEGDLTNARAQFEELLKDGGDRQAAGAVHRRLAYIHLLQGKDSAALSHARRAVDFNPSSSQYRRFLAGVLDLSDRRREAFQQLKSAHRLAPHDAGLLSKMARRHRENGDHRKALEFAEEAVVRDPENPLYHRELSSLYQRAGVRDKAIQHWNRAHRLQEAFEDFSRAIKILRQGRHSEAIAFLEEVISENPEFTTGRLTLADLYQRRGRHERALELYKEVLEGNPLEDTAREQGAWLYARSGRLDEALDMLHDSTRTSPNLAILEGYRLMLSEDWDGALERFRSFESNNPVSPELMKLISHCLSAKGETSRALSYLEKAGRISGDDKGTAREARNVRFEEGTKAMDRRQWEQAIQVFDSLLAERPMPEYYFNAGYSRQKLGRLERAIDDYRNGLRMQPGADWARLNLATSLYLRRRYYDSARQWERLLTDEPSRDGYFQLGMCYSHMGQLGQAEGAFRRSLKLGKGSPELFYNLGLTRFRLGRRQDGMSLIRKASGSGYGPAISFMAWSRRGTPR